jgi:haloalkane dehalogenase
MVTPDTPIPGWLKELYPYQPKQYQPVPGVRMSYLDEGPRGNRAVVMVHGNPTWSFYYRHLIQALSPNHRCIAPDHIGMGLSDKPQTYAYTLEQRIRDLSGLIENLGLCTVDLVVHDWGGAIGLGWAVLNPQKVGRIVILNSAAFTSTLIPTRIELCKTHPLGTWIIRGFNGFAWPATRMSMKRGKLGKEERRAYLFPYGDWHDRVAVNQFVKDIPLNASHPSFQTLKNIEDGLQVLAAKPISLLWGGADFCFTRYFLREYQQYFPQAESTLFEDLGHYIAEDGREEVTEAIGDFLGKK